MSMLPVGIGSAEAGGYQISRSLRFNSADSANLSKSFTATSSCTFSFWVKRANLGSEQYLFWCDGGSGNHWGLRYDGDDKFTIFKTQGGSDTSTTTTAVYRDVGGWYHVVVNGTPTLYINGVQAVTGSYTWAHIGGTAYIGRRNSTYLNAYLTEFHYIDGSNLTPSSFGETDTDTGVWKPKAYSGSYGTNGFYLKFADNSGTTSTTLGKDSSGNGNNWTPNNFSVTAGAGNDSLVDTPTNYGTDTGVGGEVRGNYATANPLNKPSTSTITNGNLDVTHTAFGGEQPATIAISSGKWYWEAIPSSNLGAYGIILTTATPSASSIANGYHYYGGNGNFFTGSSGVSYGATFNNGDVIGVALDLDTNQITFYKNGASQGVKSINAGTYYPDMCAAGINTTNANFGQRPFAYTAPSGFKALCTQNLPEPTIVKANEYFDTLLWTGNGSNPRTLSGLNFAADMIWHKSRSNASVSSHAIQDAVRGFNTNNNLYTNLTGSETAFPNRGVINSVSATGFTFNNNASDYSAADGLNENTQTFVAWNWKANGAGSTNTAGTITSTVSVNTTSGFSIVTFATGTTTGARTIGHGLGVKPSLIITRPRDAADNWAVYHASLGATKVLTLNATSAETTSNLYWSNTEPTSTVFTGAVGGSNYFYTSKNYVAYCFAPVSGYSAFGSYTGNGSSDGPMIFTNFRPAFVMIKRTDSTSDWNIRDDARNPNNVNNNPLWPNLSSAESPDAAHNIDILSNGFKIRASSAWINASGGTFIYMAFASNPFRYSLAA